MTVEHLLHKAAELNLDGVQLADPRHLDSFEYGHISALRQMADSLGLYIELGTSGLNPEHLQTMVRAAHVLGASLVRTYVGQPRPHSAQAMEQLIAEAAAQLRETLPICERYGVTLALENHQDLTADELLSLLELLDHRWIGVCFDTGNPLALLEDPLEAAYAFAPLIRSVHLKDYKVIADRDGFSLLGCTLGEGIVDLQAIIDLLRVEAPDATVNIEVFIGDQPVPALKDEYLATLPEATARSLGRTLRLVRDCGLPRQPDSVVESERTEEDILSAEEDFVARSVAWAQHASGRAPSEQ